MKGYKKDIQILLIEEGVFRGRAARRDRRGVLHLLMEDVAFSSLSLHIHVYEAARYLQLCVGERRMPWQCVCV